MNKISREESLSSNIIENRKKMNMTQADLARELSISPNTLCQWENGTRTPDMNKIMSLSNFFDISCDALIYGVSLKNRSTFKRLGLTNEAINILENYNENQKYYDNCGEETVMHTDTFFDENLTKTICKLIENKHLCRLLCDYLYMDDFSYISTEKDTISLNPDINGDVIIKLENRDYHNEEMDINDIHQLLLFKIIDEIKDMRKEYENGKDNPQKE